MTTEREVARFGPFKDFIADGVKVGDTIYLSGQVSVDSSGEVVAAGDFPAQVRQAYANVTDVLAVFGATMDDIVDEMWLITDMKAAVAQVGELFSARAEAYGGSPAVTQTMVEVSSLVRPELLIEIKCIAHL